MKYIMYSSLSKTAMLLLLMKKSIYFVLLLKIRKIPTILFKQAYARPDILYVGIYHDFLTLPSNRVGEFLQRTSAGRCASTPTHP